MPFLFFEIKILISRSGTVDYKDGFMMLKSVLSKYFQGLLSKMLRVLRKLYEITISDYFNPRLTSDSNDLVNICKYCNNVIVFVFVRISKLQGSFSNPGFGILDNHLDKLSIIDSS